MSGLSEKAIKERKYRRRENDRKRFEKPLRVFLEHKYETIYQEYTQLYDLMITNHPDKRNLINTKTFKEWMQANDANPKDILSVAVSETLGEYVPSEQPDVASEQPDVAESEQPDIVASEQPDVAESEQPDVVASEQPDVAESEQPDLESEQSVQGLESYVASFESVGANDIDRQIDQIIDELMQEEELRDVLERENDDDEGIEISVWDEIALDIEEFDYELEVDNDW